MCIYMYYYFLCDRKFWFVLKFNFCILFLIFELDIDQPQQRCGLSGIKREYPNALLGRRASSLLQLPVPVGSGKMHWDDHKTFPAFNAEFFIDSTGFVWPGDGGVFSCSMVSVQ